MTLDEERIHWKVDPDGELGKFVDKMVATLKETGADPTAYILVDMCYRPFLQWVYTAQLDKKDPTLVRNSMLHIISIMILEMSTRVNTYDEGGRKYTPVEWAMDFLDDMAQEIRDDVESQNNQVHGHA